MSKMDDIVANNPELQQAVAQEGQALKDAGVTQESPAETSRQLPDNDTKSDDGTQMYRSPESDVGNMDGKQIPDAEQQTQETASPEISDSVKDQVGESKLDSIKAGQEVKAGDSVSPRETPAVERGGNDGQER